MTSGTKRDCDAIWSYLLGELSDQGMAEMARHVARCSECKNVDETYWDVQERIWRDDAKTDALPEDLKEHVLRKAFSVRPPHHVPKPAWNRITGNLRTRPVWSILKSKWTIGVAAFVIGLVAGGYSLQTPSFSAASNTVVMQTPMLATVAFRASRARVWMIRQEDRLHLLIFAQHLPKQSPWGCYDVWIIRGHRRYSVAEFIVGENGMGTVAAVIPAQWRGDAVEITREPGWHDPLPKGPRVLSAML